MTIIFPKNNLPEASQPWAREIQKQMVDISSTNTADEINNLARDNQLNSSLLALTGVVNDTKAVLDGLTSLGTSGSLYDINADNITAGTIDASIVNVTDINASNITAGTLTADFINGGTITASNVDLTSGTYGIKVGASGESAYLNCFVGSGDGTTFGMAGFSGSISGGSPTVTNTGWVASFYPRTDGGPNLGSAGRRWDTLFATNATINTSDAREKTDVLTSTLGLDFINQLNPVSYKRTDGVRTHYGLIAQEVEQVLVDNNITTENFAGFIRGDMNDPESILGLRYSEFISPMIKAIQELTDRIETLEKGA